MGCGASKQENQPVITTSQQQKEVIPLVQQQQQQQKEPVPAGSTTNTPQATKNEVTDNIKKSHLADNNNNNSNSNNNNNKPKVESFFPPAQLNSDSNNNNNNNNNSKEIPSSPKQQHHHHHHHPTAAVSKKEETTKKSSYVPPAPITASIETTAAASENNEKNNNNNNEDEQSLQQIIDSEDNQSGLLVIDEEELNQLQQINNNNTKTEKSSTKKEKSATKTEKSSKSSSKTTSTKIENKGGINLSTSSTSATTNMSSSQSKYVFEYPDETPEPNSTSGMRFEEIYRLKGVLGTGAFSTVREGYHRSNTTISYAVKCINRKKLSEEDEIALLDEVSILKEMKHCKHIIRLFDFYEEPNTYYLVMERMRGGELFDRIVAKAYYNEKEARDTCKIILQAIQYCHSHHVAHRDLKPENLLLLSDLDDSQVKIADFGFAKKVYEPNSLSTQCGTPGYVAPEILEGVKYDERADMWSVGVILYILLGGYPPFIESTQRDLFRKIRKGDYEFHEEYWGTVSKEAKQLIQSLLTVDMKKRLTAKQALEQNEWILELDNDKLANKFVNLEKLRNFNAKRKFRAAVHTVMAANKLNLVGKEFFTSSHLEDRLKE